MQRMRNRGGCIEETGDKRQRRDTVNAEEEKQRWVQRRYWGKSSEHIIVEH
jgi:hypothetical protein